MRVIMRKEMTKKL